MSYEDPNAPDEVLTLKDQPVHLFSGCKGGGLPRFPEIIPEDLQKELEAEYERAWWSYALDLDQPDVLEASAEGATALDALLEEGNDDPSPEEILTWLVKNGDGLGPAETTYDDAVGWLLLFELPPNLETLDADLEAVLPIVCFHTTPRQLPNGRWVLAGVSGV